MSPRQGARLSHTWSYVILVKGSLGPLEDLNFLVDTGRDLHPVERSHRQEVEARGKV